jgi:hypothetical protein
MPSASLSSILSDTYLFPVLQGLVVLTGGIAVLMELITRFRAGFGSTRLIVTRSQTSMAIYYGTYAAATGVLVALCSTVEFAEHHRVAWVLLDVLVTSYLCLFNPWFRLKLQALSSYLASAERR